MPENLKRETQEGDNIESETEPKILDTFQWVDKEGIRGEKGFEYQGVIRYAQGKDWEGFKAIEMDKRKQRHKRGERYYDLTEEPEGQEFDKTINEPDKFATIVLTIDGEAVAHVAFAKDPERDATVELGTVTTMEKYKRKGLMRRLLKFVEQEAHNVFGADTIRLSTQEKNEEAAEFYPKVGYKFEGERIKREKGEWKGESPYWSVIFVKHLEKPKE